MRRGHFPSNLQSVPCFEAFSAVQSLALSITVTKYHTIGRHSTMRALPEREGVAHRMTEREQWKTREHGGTQ